MATSESLQKYNWLYPDLLTKNELIDTLRKRYIKITDLEQLPKDELVELYNKYILPLPQRKHRLNRRGREMTKKQIIRAKKRKNTEITFSISTPDDGQPSEKRRSTGQLQNDISSPSSSTMPGGDRLKPPPSCINFEKKTIKLNSSSKSQTISPISSSLNQLKINQSSSITNAKPNKSDSSIIEKKEIKLKDTEVSSKNENNELDGTEDKAKLDKKVDESLNKLVPMDTSEKLEDSTKQKKIKIKRIAWP